MEEFYNFCFNFFKGIDITAEVDVKCEIFQLYTHLGQLHKDPNQLNLDYNNKEIWNFLGWSMDENIYRDIVKKGKIIHNNPINPPSIIKSQVHNINPYYVPENN